MISILFDLLSSRKISTTPFKSWKIISLKLPAKGIKKEAKICADFKRSKLMCYAKMYRKTDILVNQSSWRKGYAPHVILGLSNGTTFKLI
jgi:hypothetical protein